MKTKIVCCKHYSKYEPKEVSLKKGKFFCKECFEEGIKIEDMKFKTIICWSEEKYIKKP